MARTAAFHFPNLAELAATDPKTDPFTSILWHLSVGPADEIDGLWDVVREMRAEDCPLGVHCPVHGEAVLAAYKPAGHDHGLPF